MAHSRSRDTDERSTRPIIGLTSDRLRTRAGEWDVQASFLPSVYIDAVARSGGTAVILPPQPVTATIATSVIESLDGVIVTAGGDIAPERYGATRHSKTQPPNIMRDAWEDAILTAAIAEGVPFLGICRGMQMLNVNRGGTLLQHLPDVVGDDRYDKGSGTFALNHVAIEGGNLSSLLGQDAELEVKSYHHQAVQDVGAGLRVSARSADGVIQAIELERDAFGVAVQWHPEQDALEDPRLFDGLVNAARLRRANRPSALGHTAHRGRSSPATWWVTRYPLPML